MEGTPQAAQACSIHVVPRDATQNGSSVEADVSLRILAPPPAISTPSIGPATLSKPFVQELQSTGGHGASTWYAEDLPPGLTLQGSRITGTVSAERSSCDVYNVTLRLEDEVGRSARETFQMVVLPGRLIEVPFSAPGAILAAPNLLLTDTTLPSLPVPASATTRIRERFSNLPWMTSSPKLPGFYWVQGLFRLCRIHQTRIIRSLAALAIHQPVAIRVSRIPRGLIRRQ